jgi:hypothetical protein
MSNLAKNETLLTAYDAHGRAQRRVQGGDLSPEAVMGLIRAENVLFDASLACGMSYDEPVVEAWAVQRVTRLLCEA